MKHSFKGSPVSLKRNLGSMRGVGLLGALATFACMGGEVGEAPEEELGQISQQFTGTLATVTSNYNTWKTNYVADVAHCGGVTPCKRVRRPDEGNDTVSEGIAYGALLAAYLDDRATLDGLWNYYRTHVNERGVMHWRWDANNNKTGDNEATDAIEDMAIALIVADKKGWGTPQGDNQTYNARAQLLIGKTLQYFVMSTNETRPGDAIWEVWDRVYNPSYIIAPYATVFAEYTNTPRWNQVKDKDYQLLGYLDANDSGASSTGLVPDWMYFNGTQNYNGHNICNDIHWDKTNTGGCRVWWFSYDACRAPWRLAMDWAWHGDTRAGARLDKLNAWASPKNGDILNGYYLNGTEPPVNEYPAGQKTVLGAFVGPFAAASAKGSSAYQTTMWNKLVGLGQGSNYFSDTVRMLGMLFLSGNMPNPLTIGGTARSTYGNNGNPWSVPGKIEIENFDNGGQSVTYNDTTAGNTGGAYRSTDVDLQASGDTGGTSNVGWTAAGEWLEYTVNVGSSGTYDIETRVATPNTGQTFKILVGGTDVTGNMTVPNTGAWQTYTTVTKTGVSLTAGTKYVRFVFNTGGINVNWINIKSAGGGGGCGGGDLVSQAESGTLTGVNTSTSVAGYSGSGYVTGFDVSSDRVSVSPSVCAGGSKSLVVRYRIESGWGDKTNDIYVNGSLVKSHSFTNTNGAWAETTIGSYNFNTGANTVALQSNWGWMDVDYFKVVGGN